MDEPSPRSRAVAASNAVGLHSYLAIFLVCLAATAAVIWILPPVSFVFGVGWFATFFTVSIVFIMLSLFRRLIFKQLYGKVPNESEAVLLEYFAQQDEDDKEDISTELIENALHLREIYAGDCMAAAKDIVYFPVSHTLKKLRHLFTESQLSRIIITESESLDTILGYIHVQQMFGEEKNIRQLVLPIQFVPATLPANELLNRFVRTRTNIACVSDANGQLAGIVTLEDALEQLFGAIDDEHD
ncbi:MAG: hypothetical protein RIR11_140 [Bacteroidota bacterium]|jgi:CBS domain containing-hemolysin-like protein